MEEFKKATSQATVTVNTTEPIIPQFKNNLVLIVNTASECGFTNQYAGLQELHEKYKDKGLVVIAYPSNTFKNQEPGSNEEIAKFCKTNFGITFPIMPKCEILGEAADPMYKKLFQASGIAPKWNFHKYLVTATQVSSFDHFTEPAELDSVIEELVSK